MDSAVRGPGGPVDNRVVEEDDGVLASEYKILAAVHDPLSRQTVFAMLGENGT